MIPITDILDAVNRRVLQLWPQRTVYVEVCPADFARPSTWLLTAENSTVRANRYLVRRTIRIQTTIFDQMDEHYEASAYRLTSDADQLLSILAAPLLVSGRALTTVCRAQPRQPDRAVLSILLTFMDTLPMEEISGDGDTMERAEIRVDANKTEVWAGTLPAEE